MSSAYSAGGLCPAARKARADFKDGEIRSSLSGAVAVQIAAASGCGVSLRSNLELKLRQKKGNLPGLSSRYRCDLDVSFQAC